MKLQTIATTDYEIKIGSIFQYMRDYIMKLSSSKYVLFMDENTEKNCLPVLEDSLGSSGLSFSKVVISSGEQNKTIDTCKILWEELTKLQADRSSIVIHLSGGVLSDMGGFVAATYKRGVPFINMPTTLLSMVDASVGGKLGVDFNGFKNHIGLFKNPEGIFIFPGFLKTLPERELLSGFAEIIKHGLIADKSYFQLIRQAGHPSEITDEKWIDFIAKSIEIKKKIVEGDPFEKGPRKILNFGHTAGHAIESWSFKTSNPLRHGEAIAIGMMVEAYLSMKTSGLSHAEMNQIIDFLCEIFPFPNELQNANFDELVQIMKQDKKNRNGMILFTLLKEQGKAVYDEEIHEDEIKEALNFYLNYNF